MESVILLLFLNARIVFFSKGDSHTCIVPWGQMFEKLIITEVAKFCDLYNPRVY